MKRLLTKKNIAVTVSVVSVVASAVLLRKNLRKVDEIQIGDTQVDDVSEEEIVEVTPVSRNVKKD